MPKRNRPEFVDRQLTVGECIAIERYGASELDERPMTTEQLFLLIDRLEVCTTCGWSAALHRAESRNGAVVLSCGVLRTRYAQD